MSENDFPVEECSVCPFQHGEEKDTAYNCYCDHLFAPESLATHGALDSYCDDGPGYKKGFPKDCPLTKEGIRIYRED
jgi:hypothetical protein